MAKTIMKSGGKSNRSSLIDRVLWQPSLTPGIKIQDVEGDVILLDKENQRVHQLDHIGARILRFCDGSRSVEDIVKQMLQEFDVGQEKLTVDVAMLLNKMRTLGLLT